MTTIQYSLKAEEGKVRTLQVPPTYHGYYSEHVATVLGIPITDLIFAHEKRTPDTTRSTR